MLFKTLKNNTLNNVFLNSKILNSVLYDDNGVCKVDWIREAKS